MKMGIYWMLNSFMRKVKKVKTHIFSYFVRQKTTKLQVILPDFFKRKIHERCATHWDTLPGYHIKQNEY